jgi:leader peptidase (prepilin peptidase)/N-methyltransferase
VSLDPSRSFFHLSTEQAWWLVAAACLAGFCLGHVIARWVNRLCQVPPRTGEISWLPRLTALLFAVGTLVIIGWEGQFIREVQPDLVWRYGRWISHLVLLALLIAATATDLREYTIPDQITLPGIAVGVLVATASGDVQLLHVWVDWNHPLVQLQGPEIPDWIKQHPHWHGLVWSLAGAGFGAAVTALARGISSAILGQEAMGFGDVTLMAMIGSFLGWQAMVFVFLLAPFCGLVVGVAAKSLLNRPYIPYGPYLSVAAVVVMLCWKWIWEWEPTPQVSIRRLFGDLVSLGILASVALALLMILLGIVRWWRRGPTDRSPVPRP